MSSGAMETRPSALVIVTDVSRERFVLEVKDFGEEHSDSGTWSLFGGRCADGELHQVTLARQLQEEVPTNAAMIHQGAKYQGMVTTPDSGRAAIYERHLYWSSLPDEVVAAWERNPTEIGFVGDGGRVVVVRYIRLKEALARKPNQFYKLLDLTLREFLGL
ncbi:MAG: NUDIX domain-containing protein [Deltaproteobacteria bacterium]|nr:NUDIX domain-containing protein [Deltaproteobacteria bacterium]